MLLTGYFHGSFIISIIISWEFESDVAYYKYFVLAGRDQREPPDYINTGSGQPHSLERANGRMVSVEFALLKKVLLK